jgi:hypothetical protein
LRGGGSTPGDVPTPIPSDFVFPWQTENLPKEFSCDTAVFARGEEKFILDKIAMLPLAGVETKNSRRLRPTRVLGPARSLRFAEPGLSEMSHLEKSVETTNLF